LFPLLAFTKEFGRRGSRMTVCHDPQSSAVRNSSVVIVFDSECRRFFPPSQRTRAAEASLLQSLQGRRRKIIWFDNTDSTGDVRSYLLPHVDLYLKSQLLKDRSRYARDSRTGVLFRDFYQERFGLAEETKKGKGAVADEHLHKLAVGWNAGLSNWGLAGRHALVRRLGAYWPGLGRRGLRPTPPELRRRPIDATYRGACWEGKPTVHAPRRETDRLLEQLSRKHGYRIARGGNLPYEAYLEELRRSKVVVSPFGLGEICYRDFECFLAGAVLLKPDMGHMETWPDYFEPYVTYVPYAWDFSDFEAKVAEVLENPDRYEGIARAGQQRLLESLTGDGPRAFADHVLNSLGSLEPAPEREPAAAPY
jgi:hypothetical protein